MRDKLRPAFRISIHALREEGDGKHRRTSHPQQDFYPRPPRGGRPKEIYAQGNTADISIHALREEGDGKHRRTSHPQQDFYPRPPRGGRRHTSPTGNGREPISIHALREEGDSRSLQWASTLSNFYPRPPRGGRRHQAVNVMIAVDFYPRPPRGGRLRIGPERQRVNLFLSTPSARRATRLRGADQLRQDISIHALREEGDPVLRAARVAVKPISIHALREEGDLTRLREGK